jgi:DNA repair protein SbcD/Mre11
MIKLLYFTDTHIRGSNPKSRKDNYVETLKFKFREIVEKTRAEKIDIVLFGGDLFDRPDISPSVVKEFVNILKDMPLPIYSVLGNHDVYGHNPDTVNRTILGILDTLGILKLIAKDEKVYIRKNNSIIQLTGCHYYYDIDSSPGREGYVVSKADCDYSIHMVHGFLLDRPFIEGIPFTLIDDIADKTEADITLCGHYHTGFGIKKASEKYFVNPGSLSRISSTMPEIARVPSYLIAELGSDIKLSIKPLDCALRGEEVLDRELIKKEEFKQYALNQFIQQIHSYGTFEVVNLHNIVNEIAQRENVPQEIKGEALKRLSEAEANLSNREVLK